MHIYAFGSICRGDISVDSDIDLLALVKGPDQNIDPDKFSIYSYKRIKELWTSGNAFAWHLSLESKLIFSEDGEDFLRSLGQPYRYTSAAKDCHRFFEIFESAHLAIKHGTPSLVFELSTVFLAIRNIATCYSLASMPKPIFRRDSARMIGSKSITISEYTYSILMRARLLSNRGLGDDVSNFDMCSLLSELETCRQWVDALCMDIKKYG